MRAVCLLTLIVACAFSAFPQARESPLQIDVSAAGYLADTIPYDATGLRLFDELGLLLSYRAPNILIHMEGSLRNDGAYTPEERYTLGHYIDMKNAFIALNLDRFSLTAGRYAHGDIVDSPYSLFISSASIPAMAVDARYEDDRFFYESRWVQLNYLSSLYVFPTTTERLDRGMNYKVYGLKFGDIRFGLQDSIVYVDRSFDAEFFLNPMFQYLQQLVSSTGGKPWTAKNNCNSLDGFFIDFRKPRYYGYAQILIDDLNASFLGFWGKIANVSKLAWSLGGYADFRFGRIGAYTAGATKFTFEATYATIDNYSYYPFEYTYYPTSRYELADGTPMTLDYAKNYIGYKYGENTLSFLVDYTKEFAPVTLFTSLEYVISGSKSPSNPWHEAYSWNQLDWINHSPWYLLEDPQLEHTVLWFASAVFNFGRFEADVGIRLGGRWNRLELVEVVPGEPEIFMPVGADRFLYELRLGLTWHFFT